MYKNGEAALDRISELATRCPKEFQQKCFEILLSGYVQLEVGAGRAQPWATQSQQGGQTPQQQVPLAESRIPPEVHTRFKTTAKRLEVGVDRLESLFDFSVDPFSLHALRVPGQKLAEKARHVALLAASRSYFATGSWSADWQEVKSLCVDHNCYDAQNHTVNLKIGAKKVFKNIEPGKPIRLSSDGIRRAEELLKEIAEGASE